MRNLITKLQAIEKFGDCFTGQDGIYFDKIDNKPYYIECVIELDSDYSVYSLNGNIVTDRPEVYEIV